MAIWDLFSRREKRKASQGQEDVYQYTDLPRQFRAQVVHILIDSIGKWRVAEHVWESAVEVEHPCNQWWTRIFKTMIREKGVFALSNNPQATRPADQCVEYVLSAPTNDALDLIELAFNVVEQYACAFDTYHRRQYGMDPEVPYGAVAELNQRFRENGIGYEYSRGQIIKIDSTFIHSEVVKPAIRLLNSAGAEFEGPAQEFFAAHEKYRKGDGKDAITWSLKAIESTLKAICTARGWPFDPQKDAASKLLEIVFSKGLVPAYLQGQFAALRSVLESGVPTVRNKTSGHGQGIAPTTVPDHLVQYVLHLTAANIVFLIECHQA